MPRRAAAVLPRIGATLDRRASACPPPALARLPRISLPDLPHHVLQVGNNRQAIVVDDVDREAWRAHLRESSLIAGVDIHAYALMDNHLHLLATPRRGDAALSTMMQSLGRRYVAGFNRRHGRSGSLWEGRFRAAVVEPGPALLAAMRFIDTHPQRQHLVADAAAYRWSSAAHHLGRARDTLLTDPASYWSLGNTPFDREIAWRRFVDEGVTDADALAQLQAVRRGWPIGSAAFKQGLALATGHAAAPRPRGRPAAAPNSPR